MFGPIPYGRYAKHRQTEQAARETSARGEERFSGSERADGELKQEPRRAKRRCTIGHHGARSVHDRCKETSRSVRACMSAAHERGTCSGANRETRVFAGEQTRRLVSTRYKGYRRVTLQRLQGRVTLQTLSDNACDPTASTSVAQNPDQGAGHLPELSVPHSSKRVGDSCSRRPSFAPRRSRTLTTRRLQSSHVIPRGANQN